MSHDPSARQHLLRACKRLQSPRTLDHTAWSTRRSSTQSTCSARYRRPPSAGGLATTLADGSPPSVRIAVSLGAMPRSLKACQRRGPPSPEGQRTRCQGWGIRPRQQAHIIGSIRCCTRVCRKCAVTAHHWFRWHVRVSSARSWNGKREGRFEEDASPTPDIQRQYPSIQQ